MPYKLSSAEQEAILQTLTFAVKIAADNPRFQVHEMGLNLVEDIGRSIRDDIRMYDLLSSTAERDWAKIPKNLQEKFQVLVRAGIAREKAHLSFDESKLPLLQVWQEAISNPAISAMCCGGGCGFDIRLGDQHAKDSGFVTLHYRGEFEDDSTPSSCRLDWMVPPSILYRFSSSQQRSLRSNVIYLMDSGCTGSFAFGTNTAKKIPVEEPSSAWRKQVQELYDKILKTFAPTERAKPFAKSGCDV